MLNRVLLLVLALSGAGLTSGCAVYPAPYGGAYVAPAAPYYARPYYGYGYGYGYGYRPYGYWRRW